jgi:hypothetical protein
LLAGGNSFPWMNTGSVLDRENQWGMRSLVGEGVAFVDVALQLALDAL